MDFVAAYREVGTFRGAADMCGTTHRTVAREIRRHEAGKPQAEHRGRTHNYDAVVGVVVRRVRSTHGRISAKRLLPEARAAGYQGSARNFRRLVAKAKRAWRAEHHRGRRPAVWSPGDTLVIDWGCEDGLHVFCAVAAWSRWRFVRFATDERAETTLGLLAEALEELGGVPKVVLSDRMGCLKGAVVAGVVVPTPDYVRFATHYGFRPDFCEGADPESKGIVEHLVGYAKVDLVVGCDLTADDLFGANARARTWCSEVNEKLHSEIAAVPAERLEKEREILSPLPSLRPRIGRATGRKVDRLSCVRIGSAGCSSSTTMRSWRTTPSSPPARPRSSTTTTAAPGRCRGGLCGPRPSRSRRSWPSAPSPRSSSRVPHRPAPRAWQRSSTSSPASGWHTDGKRWSRPSSGQSPSPAGGRLTCAPSWPPEQARPSRPTPATRW
jgi:transposase